MEETEEIQATEFTALQQPGLTKKSNQMLRDGQGKGETGRYKLFPRLRNKKLKMEARFWPSVGSGSSDWRKEKRQRWGEEEARNSLLWVLNNADGLTASAEVAMERG